MIQTIPGDAVEVADARAVVVQHDIAFPELRRQYVHVTSRFPADAQVTELRLPTWAPGSYLQRPFDASLEILAADRDGTPVAWRKTEKDTWQVDGEGALAVRYRVHADRRSVSASWVSEDYVLLTGSSVFLYTDDSRDFVQLLNVDIPSGLPKLALPLPRMANGAFRARDYDELVDSPLLLSEAAPLSFEADGHGYQLVNVGDTALWNLDEVLADTEAIIRATNELFGAVPLERDYWIFNLLNEGNGGLEHDHSTVLQASRWQWTDRSERIQWLSLVAHEYFHVWNVRRMRPAALARYDYRREQYTRNLWIAEGITSYYDDLLLSRARVVSPAEYLERLVRQVHTLEQTPGRKRQSLADGSQSTWTRLYQPGTNAINQNISYYVKGAVVAFVLDTRLREASRGRRSLDDVLRLMWERWATTPYPESAFYDAVATIDDAETAAWLRQLIEGVEDPDVDGALDYFGLQLERHPSVAAAEAAGRPAPAGLGINWQSATDNLVVAAVIDDGAAARAGLLPGDELLAVNDERVTRSDFDRRLRSLEPGMPVLLLIARQGRIMTLNATLGVSRPLLYQVQVQNGFNDRDRRRLQSWLGQSLTVD